MDVFEPEENSERAEEENDDEEEEDDEFGIAVMKMQKAKKIGGVVSDASGTKQIDKKVHLDLVDQVRKAVEKLDEIDPQSSFTTSNQRFADRFNISRKAKNRSLDRTPKRTDAPLIYTVLQSLERLVDPETNKQFVAEEGNVYLMRAFYLGFEVMIKDLNFSEALLMLRKRLALYEKVLPAYWPVLGITHYMIGKLALYHHGSGSPQETDPALIQNALDHLQTAFRILSISHDDSHSLMVKLQEVLSQANLQLSSLRIQLSSRPRKSKN